MENDETKRAWRAMYRRWAYMIIAILAAAALTTRPVFSFHEDKGIRYVRSFSMTQTQFYVTQTELDSHIPEITASMSVKGLYYCNKVMLWGAILCLLCFFSHVWRIRIAILTAVAAGAYYAFMIYYALRMADLHYATLYPNAMALLPAIVCQMMVLTRHNVLRADIDSVDSALENEEKEED